MQAFHSDHFVLPLPAGHRFPMPKYRLLRDAVARELPQLRVCEAPAASDGELALAHTPGWIQAVAEGLLTPAQQREIGFPWSPRMAERARRSVGATIAAARAALAEGVAANLAGLCLGASQSAGRALVGWLCPAGRQAEVFGLWGLAVKLSMIIGPLAYGLISWLAGDHRQAMLATAAFFIVGLLLLARVDVQRGRARALRGSVPT